MRRGPGKGSRAITGGITKRVSENKQWGRGDTIKPNKKKKAIEEGLGRPILWGPH